MKSELNLISSVQLENVNIPKKYKRTKLITPVIKQCEFCGKDFQIIFKGDLKKRFCGTSCSAKWRMNDPLQKAKVHTKETHAKIGKKISDWLKTEKGQINVERIRNLNPMNNPETRLKVSKKLKEMHYGPSVRGGNGTGMTFQQKLMKDVLLENWIDEYAISLGKRQKGYPTNYKVDLANLKLKIAIEVDGNSHYSRKEQDKKKDEKLNSLGWKVLRFTNNQIKEWIDEGMDEKHYISITLSLNNISIKK